MRNEKTALHAERDAEERHAVREMTKTNRNSFYGFGVKSVKSWTGCEGIFTSCTLTFCGKTLGNCILSGDGGADLYDFPATKLNKAIERQIPTLPDWCKGGNEPFALSYVVAMLADWWDCGVRGREIGTPIDCNTEITDINAYQEELCHALATHR